LSSITREAARRRRLLTRALPVVLLAVAAFVAGAIVAGNRTELPAVQSFADDWGNQDFAGMHAAISPDSAKRYPLNEFTDAYGKAQQTGTVTTVNTGEVSESESDGRQVAVMPVSLDTSAFGQVAGSIELPLAGDRVDWSPDLVFPGLRDGERLVRRTRVPERAPILARGGTPLAEGAATARTSPLGEAARSATGEVSSPTPQQNQELIELGFPPGTPTGASGLELAFDKRLAGQPGGHLVAVPNAVGGPRRVLASSKPVAGTPVHTTIDPDLQRAAAAALAGQYGGVAVLDAKDGSVLALAGIALSGAQPPGSTFKLITTTAALDAGLVKLTDQFPIQTSTVVGGREVANAHNEACGGSFADAFAQSCNSVFVPLGPKIGSQRLVGTAEQYGFNSLPSLFDDRALQDLNPPESTIPTSISDELDLGVTAIGQGQVLATPLEMASVAQTVANGGVRSPTPLVRDRSLLPAVSPVRVTSSETAATLRELMIRVVTSGTGTAAALPGVQVAGKTGTAELGPKALEPGQSQSDATAEQDVDAWFTGFAPASQPSLVAAAMVVNASGDGGTVAAPIVRQVLGAGLGVG
jgi:Penicillin binding protein transpeptidase domain/Penicillin-binding Protein dimerisation domain/NTF2-like N-terminal transpeptidase domain